MNNKLYIHKISASILLILSVFFFPTRIKAQVSEEARPVTSVYSLGLGGTSVKATYLSPLTYTGTSLSAHGTWSKAFPYSPENSIMVFEAGGNFDNLLNPAQTATMVGLNGEFSWSLEWRKRLSQDFQVTAGGGINISGGAYYLLRNSNNPVQAMAETSLQISGSVSKHFVIGRLPILITERIKLPSLGVFFCPGYGETYYEIYLGNHSGLAHAGWWGNNFRLNNLLSVTLDFGKTAMEIGYRLDVYNQWANNLNTKIVTNSFVIGIIPHGIGLKKGIKANYSVY